MGMADTLIARLSNIREITVRPISSVRKYTALEQDPVAAGREQRVDAVLDGQIQMAAEKVRVTVQLLRVPDGTPIWSSQFDEKMTDKDVLRSEAMVELEVDKQRELIKAKGSGPVNALDKALRQALERFYPQLSEVRLVDYKVRVLSSTSGTASLVRVLIESSDGKDYWNTVGVSENIIQASWMALVDSIEYKLLKDLQRK